jgi:protocadherin Fat 1/2/3
VEELNHEATARHELTVMVRDGGSRMPKRGFARVVVNVVDHNDHAPEFLSSEYEGHVYSTAAAGTSVLQVQAWDRDKGLNAEVSYSIASGERERASERLDETVSGFDST